MRAILVFLFASLFLTACGDGGGGGSSGSSGGSAPTPTNLTTITVSGSLKSTFNIPTVSLTICPPSSNSATASGCSTISDILVDTGSYGLRIYGSVLPSNYSSIFPLAPPLSNSGSPSNSGGAILAQCTAFADTTYIAGTIRTVDLFTGGEHARNLPIQVIADKVITDHPSLGSALTCGGAIAATTPTSFGTNGVLGIGPMPDDTGTGSYYTCDTTNFTCTAIADTSVLTSTQIVANPITYFQTDNAGSAIYFPTVSASGQSSATGYLYYGIYTATNNRPSASANYIALDGSTNYFNTRIVQTNTNYPNSFIDSGSNILFFNSPNSSISLCSTPKFYCPSSGTQSFSAVLGASGSQLSFSVGNFNTLWLNPTSNSAFNNLAGPGSGTIAGNDLSFDWGLPFFFGRTVYTAIKGQTINNISTPTPFYAVQ